MHTAILLAVLPFTARPQCKTNTQFAEQLVSVERDADLSNGEKLFRVDSLKKAFEKCKLNKDSVYAKILHRLGAIQYAAGKFDEGINNTIASAKINSAGKKESSRRFAVNSYFNLGFCYQQLRFYNEALDNYERCITIGKEYRDAAMVDRVIRARIKKGNIFYQTGDYQKDVEEMSIGLKTASAIMDSTVIVDLLNERAQAFIALRSIPEAMNDLERALLFINKDDYTAYANNYKIRAARYEAANNFPQAIAYHKKAIIIRTRTGDTGILAADYNDAGKTMIAAQLYADARSYLKQSLSLAQKTGNHVIAAKASSNLGLVSLQLNSYPSALSEYQSSLLQTVPAFKTSNGLNNPSYLQCNAISDKNFLSLLLANKVECLLYLYKQTGNPLYLSASLKTARLTDSIITDVRFAQSGEQSKLYWRHETREFFSNAIEACFQAKDAIQAFFFMEKSRAILLNDRLNELGASAYLPPEEERKERTMQINVFALQQQLAQATGSGDAFDEQQLELLEAKDQLEKYLKTLKNKYPAYYQYNMPTMFLNYVHSKNTWALIDRVLYTILSTIVPPTCWALRHPPGS